MKRLVLHLCLLTCLVPGCGDEEHDENEADQVGVGAACVNDMDCEDQSEQSETGAEDLACLSQFAGGYCGLEGCMGNDDCPDGAACVAHTDGVNYCFRRCIDKSECNANRPPEVEANCSANIEFVDASTSGKACVPPSSGL